MSRIGKKPVYLPEGVTATISDDEVIVKGPKGELKIQINKEVSVKQETVEDKGDALIVTVESRDDNPMWGTTRALLQNMIDGVVTGWSKSLELNGVGFKMNLQGKLLVLALGFSHEVRYDIPEGIDASIEGMILKIDGINRQLVGKVAAEIRAFKKPEPYKGKGFRYTDEVIRRKVGKAAKAE